MPSPVISQQQPLPLAFVNGEAIVEKPEDLYIPPDALEVILDRFEGPLDLLLYLIRRQKFDIVALPVLQITQQYMQYVEAMTDVKLELAGEYLLMAAMLAEIKSRLLLPSVSNDDDDELDPRAELIRRLKEYEQIKHAAEKLDHHPRLDRDFFIATADTSDNVQLIKHLPQITMQEVALAFAQAIQRANAFEHHQVAKEALSTRERMSKLMQQLSKHRYIELSELLEPKEGKAGLVVTFLAILELSKEGLAIFSQTKPYAPIHVKLGDYEQD